MSVPDVVIYLMLRGFTFDEAIHVVKMMAEISVDVSKAINGIIENIRSLQATNEGKPSE